MPTVLKCYGTLTANHTFYRVIHLKTTGHKGQKNEHKHTLRRRKHPSNWITNKPAWI